MTKKYRTNRDHHHPRKRGHLISVFGRQRYQLLGAIVIAAILPFIARYQLSGIIHFWDQFHSSLYVLIGILISHLLIQDLSRYPGEDPFSSTIPSVVIAFSCVVIMIAMAHLSYSRMIVLSGFVGTLLWYSLVEFMKTRILVPRLMLAVKELSYPIPSHSSAEWIKLTDPPNDVEVGYTDGLVIQLSSRLPKEWQDFAVTFAATGHPVYDAKQTFELMTGEVFPETIEDIGLSTLLPNRSYIVCKSIVDVFLAIVMMPLAMFVVAIASIAIKIESKGPALFIQKRVGYRGNVFECYKLRTMANNAESLGPQYTLDNDPRVTRVGRVLRKYRVDEIPQIINVVRGEMSWIGPRPEAISLARRYEENIPFYAFRHCVKPGLTGWAAIRQGNVAEIDAAKVKLSNDFFYIKNISLGLDAFICIKTIWIIFTGFGSR